MLINYFWYIIASIEFPIRNLTNDLRIPGWIWQPKDPLSLYAKPEPVRLAKESLILILIGKGMNNFAL